MFFVYIVFVTCFVPSSYGANILAIMPTPSYSHQIAFTPLWKELSLRGHKVTVITTDPMKDPNLTNLTEIDLKWSYKFFTNITEMAEKWSIWNAAEAFAKLSLVITEAQLSYPPVQELVHSKKHFDVVLVEHLFPEFLGFAELYRCPKILIGSLDTFTYIHQAIGNPTHPVLYPEMLTPFYGPLSFKERVISTLYNWYTAYIYAYRGFTERQKVLRKTFNTTLSLTQILNNIDLILLNVSPVIQGVRAVGPTTINIGGFRQTMYPKPLPRDLKEFLDSAKNGVIYFSLGSNVKSKELGKQALNIITETLRELPYKVLWKFEADSLLGKPNNVKLVKWAPQQEVLAHPNLKLFVTQGGLQSLEEGIYAEIPFVVIPFFADQHQNARLMEDKGIAKVVDRKPSITKEELRNAILEVIAEPRYKNSVKQLKQLILDNPMTGLEKSVWWTEYVIRNKGATHLRNPAADLPWYQYLLIDVIGFLILSTVLLLYTLTAGLKFLYKSLIYRCTDKNFMKSEKLQ